MAIDEITWFNSGSGGSNTVISTVPIQLHFGACCICLWWAQFLRDITDTSVKINSQDYMDILFSAWKIFGDRYISSIKTVLRPTYLFWHRCDPKCMSTIFVTIRCGISEVQTMLWTLLSRSSEITIFVITCVQLYLMWNFFFWIYGTNWRK